MRFAMLCFLIIYNHFLINLKQMFFRDTSLESAAVGNCTILQNCSVTAANICSTNGITYEKVQSNCSTDFTDDTCPANYSATTLCGDGCPAPSPSGK